MGAPETQQCRWVARGVRQLLRQSAFYLEDIKSVGTTIQLMDVNLFRVFNITTASGHMKV